MTHGKMLLVALLVAAVLLAVAAGIPLVFCVPLVLPICPWRQQT